MKNIARRIMNRIFPRHSYRASFAFDDLRCTLTFDAPNLRCALLDAEDVIADDCGILLELVEIA